MLDEQDDYITPGAFIPAATRYGLMNKIDRWVIAKLFNDYSHVFMQNSDLVLNLNLSAQSIADDSMIDYVTQLFDTTVILPKQICFEISETVLINNYTSAGLFIEQIGNLGCAFALDNFGSGLSSFAYLKSIKVDFLKIDGDLIRDICDDIVDRTMIESINTMAHLLGVKSIAECADNERVIREIKKLGLDYAQGYFLGDLVSLDNFTNLGSENRDIASILLN
jgi:EAL domain-containing protein (putative c-di-GMP-specific phosphodiesterase class I)